MRLNHRNVKHQNVTAMKREYSLKNVTLPPAFGEAGALLTPVFPLSLSTVTQSLDCLSGLHNCFEFSQHVIYYLKHNSYSIYTRTCRTVGPHSALPPSEGRTPWLYRSPSTNLYTKKKFIFIWNLCMESHHSITAFTRCAHKRKERVGKMNKRLVCTYITIFGKELTRQNKHHLQNNRIKSWKGTKTTSLSVSLHKQLLYQPVFLLCCFHGVHFWNPLYPGNINHNKR